MKYLSATGNGDNYGVLSAGNCLTRTATFAPNEGIGVLNDLDTSVSGKYSIHYMRMPAARLADGR